MSVTETAGSASPSTASGETWTIGRLLTWTADYLKKQGSESPRLDAEVLLAFARGCQRIELYTAFGDIADDKLRTQFRDLVRQRALGTPVAYLVGRREFYSISFRVTPAVLIPRPETEFVVIEVLDRVKGLGDAAVADIGTGSGAIAVSVAKHAPRARVKAVDLSPAALEVARGNIVEQGVSDRVECLLGDLLEPLPAGMQFDVIASNPPYVSESEYASLARDVKDHEPRMALVGGPTGAEVIARLVSEAADRVRTGGFLIVEISPMILDAVKELAAADSRWRLAAVVKDLAGHPRVVTLQRV
ncbi:MAG: peptide chain release factor N(5)-glutamine methyltransferase [Planctomycetota bacterium]